MYIKTTELHFIQNICNQNVNFKNLGSRQTSFDWIIVSLKKTLKSPLSGKISTEFRKCYRFVWFNLKFKHESSWWHHFFSISVGYIEISNLNVTLGRKVRDHQWVDLVKHYWAILLVVLVAALIIALMPIIGWVNRLRCKNSIDNFMEIYVDDLFRLCVCCCRCAGACGGRSQPFDKKHDTCRRIFLGFFLIVVATGLV